MGRTSLICFPFVQLSAEELMVAYWASIGRALEGLFLLAVCACRLVRYTLGDSIGFEPCFRYPDRRTIRTLSFALDAISLSN